METRMLSSGEGMKLLKEYARKERMKVVLLKDFFKAQAIEKQTEQITFIRFFKESKEVALEYIRINGKLYYQVKI
ncbi:hypothetical protein [Enterococcus sp. LJL51]|uniref:hypothetical protein n=1 Tax=Enterococcus sp. LJL51 TaxID=3416656 RepID=UPI003CF7F031